MSKVDEIESILLSGKAHDMPFKAEDIAALCVCIRAYEQCDIWAAPELRRRLEAARKDLGLD